MDTTLGRQRDADEPDGATSVDEEEVDLRALTDAVERLWRRELEIERERLWGGAPRRSL